MTIAISLGVIIFLLLFYRGYRTFQHINLGLAFLYRQYCERQDMDSTYKLGVVLMIKQDYINAYTKFNEVLQNFETDTEVYTLEYLKMNIAFCNSPLPWIKTLRDKSGSYLFYYMLKKFGNSRSQWYPGINEELNDAIDFKLYGFLGRM